MPIKTEREYRAMSLLLPAQESKRLQSDYYVEGNATTFNDPYLMGTIDGRKYYEIIDRKALDGADITDVIMQYDHEGRVMARQSNGTLGIEPTDKGLFIFADLSKSTAAKEFYEEIRNGLITKMSWGFVANREMDEYERSALSVTRSIRSIKKVFDVSGVSRAANPGTEISARSWLDGVIDAEKREAQAQLELAKARYFYFNQNIGGLNK
jgi:HK97 family phage prohead protease